MRADRNDPDVRPGDPYPSRGNEPLPVAARRVAHASGERAPACPRTTGRAPLPATMSVEVGTTSVVAADEEGWVVSMTPSGAWNPAVIAGRTGIGLSQRMQAFVLDAADNPYNVLAPGKQPRVTLTPTLSLKDGQPHLAFAVQGGDTQDQNLLQFFLNVVEFGMNVQQATEAANINSHQLRDVFAATPTPPGPAT